MEILEKIQILKKCTKNLKLIEESLKLSESEDIYEILGSLLNSSTHKTGFSSMCFEKYAKDENEYINFLQCPPVEEGIFVCKKCKSRKIFTMSKQTRRCDEATTVFARCSECKYGWILN